MVAGTWGRRDFAASSMAVICSGGDGGIRLSCKILFKFATCLSRNGLATSPLVQGMP